MNADPNRLDGLRVVVTGAAGGIGWATVEAVAAQGGRAAALDLREPEAKLPDGVINLRADVCDQASVTAAIDTAAETFGGLDVLVNNAGVGAVGTVEEGEEDEWRRVLDVNLLGAVRASRAALPHLRRSDRAAIVNLGSAVADQGFPNRACYSASKGAITSLTYAMASDLVKEGIRVNAVAPGTVGTAWVQRLLDQADDPQRSHAALTARQPLGRLGEAREVAEAIVFLASSASSFCTGTVLAIDGGISGVRVAG